MSTKEKNMFKTAITGCGRKFGARECELLESTVTAEILKGCNCFALVGQWELNGNRNLPAGEREKRT